MSHTSRSSTLWSGRAIRILELITERGVSLALGFGVSVLLARHLGPTEFGSYSLGLAILALVGPLTTMGLNHVLTREFVNSPSASGTVLRTAIAVRVVGSVVGGTFAIAVSSAVGLSSQVVLMVSVLAVANVARAFGAVEFYCFAVEQTRAVAAVKVVAGFAGAAAVLLAIRVRAGFDVFVLAKALEFVVTGSGFALAAWLLLGKAAFERIDVSLVRPLLASGTPLLLSAMAASLYLRIDQVMLAQLGSVEDVGIYAVAAQLSEVWYFVPEIVAAAFFPLLLAAKLSDPKEYMKRYQALIDLLALAGFAVAMLVSAFGASFLVRLYGAEYQESAAVLVLHVWAAVFVFVRAALSKYLIAENLLAASVWTHGAGAVANVLLNLVLIPEFGPKGAAIATVISYFVASLGVLVFYKPTRRSARMMALGLLIPVRIFHKQTRQSIRLS